MAISEYGEYKGWWPDSGRPIKAEEWALARTVKNREVSSGEIIDIQCFVGRVSSGCSKDRYCS